MQGASTHWRVIFERGEQIAFIALSVHLLMKFWGGMFQPGNVISTLYVIDQTVVVLFLLCRRPAQNVSERPFDHIIATLSAVVPLLAQPPSADNQMPVMLLLPIFVTGSMLHIGAKLSLRRSFGILPANRGIKSGGMYRFVRHPMYLGYLLVYLSLVLAGPTAWNTALLIASCVLFAVRISFEERLLVQSPDYREFCLATPYKLIPGIY